MKQKGLLEPSTISNVKVLNCPEKVLLGILRTHLLRFNKYFLTLFIALLVLSIKISANVTNLLDNPGAESDYTGWSRTNGGSGWSTTGTGPHSGSKCWNSSYDPCTLSQTIDLLAKGYTTEVLDSAPQISAGAFVTTNYFSSGILTIKIELLNEAGTVISTRYAINNQTLNHKNWLLRYTTISGYGIGLRKIRFTMVGEGTLYWAGQYGPSFDDAFVYLITKTKAISDDATQVVPRSATVNGLVYANGKNTTVRFEYGTSMAFGNSVIADPSPVSGTSPVLVSKSLTGLRPNTTYYTRIYAVNTSDTSYSEIITFKTQPLVLSSSVTSVAIGDTVGNTATVNITSTIAWKAVDNANWLTISPDSVTGNGTLTLLVTETNPTMEARIATITLSGDSLPNVIITVTQAKGSINLKPSTMNVNSDADTFSIKVISLFKWAAVSNVTWIKVSSDSIIGSASLSFIVTENAGSVARAGTIKFSNSKISSTFTVNQAKGVITFTPSSMSVSADIDTFSINVGTNFMWGAVSSVSWITVSNDSVNGSAPLLFSVNENNNDVSRTGTIIVSNSRISGTFTVTQGILKGKGTAEKPYLISDYNDLKLVRNNLTAYYQLTNDIDAKASISDNSPYGFDPIGNSSTPFKGQFNGTGFIIKNLYINRSDYYEVGLFGGTSNAVINNVGIINSNIKGYSMVGTFVGYFKTSSINNCFVSGSLSGQDEIGGLVGYSSGSQINNCYVAGAVSGTYYIGGLVGSSSSTPIKNSYATADVAGSYYIGGMVGENWSSAITNCFSTGSISGSSSKGGMIGYNMGGTITSCFYNRETTRLSDTNRGTPKTTSQLKTATIFSGWDFTDKWILRNDTTYPGIRGLNNSPFSFRDTLEVKGYTSVQPILANDYDIETLQSNLVFKISKLYGKGNISNSKWFCFPVGTAVGTLDSMLYNVGEVISEGDTLWGNTAIVVLRKVTNSPPNALNDTITIIKGNTVKFSLQSILTNDSDSDNNIFNFGGIVSGYPKNGNLTVSNDTLTYSPNKDWHGIDSVLYVTNDGEYTDTAVIFIIVVAKLEITWANPDDIMFGMVLGASQLNAIANTPGTFIYDPAPGTILKAGTSQVLSVNFIPDDTILYTTAGKSVNINVNKSIVPINWNYNANIVYGAALQGTELNSGAPVPGIFTYNPAIGTVLNAGDNQDVDIKFTPEDTLNFETISQKMSINVAKAELYITANSDTSLQGNAIPEFILSYSGFVNNDTISDLDNLPIASTLATSLSPVGEYEITLSGGSDNNYNLLLFSGILTITTSTFSNNIEIPLVSVYPNPFTDILTIGAINESNGKYILISILGNIIEQGIIKCDKTNLELSHLKAGTYILQVTINGETQKIAVVKR